ncbi:MAG: hypothetical protein PHR81_06555 [Bacteroidales bacterium]|jgi:hypothetical protein|nr:hypothetical protein [Bacteroidales bacterium]MDD4214455.1 hypothetical protein [Bacteroidales bacterium]
MKKFFVQFLLLFVSFCFFTYISCTKSSVENKLQGKWKYVNVENFYDTTYVEDWEFKSGGELIIHYRDLQWMGNPDTVVEYKGFYSMDSYEKFTVSGIENPHLPYYNCQWEIVKMNNNILMIVNNVEGGLYFREFSML